MSLAPLVATEPIRVVHACANPKHLIVLVHGTSKHSTWNQDGSPLVRYLVSALGENAVAIFARDWFGDNSIRDRDLGAATLQEDVQQLCSLYPTAMIDVIAHSHGGNLAGKAIANMKTSNVGLASLSTPFLSAHKRTGGYWAIKYVLAVCFFLNSLMLFLLIVFANTALDLRHKGVVIAVSLLSIGTLLCLGAARIIIPAQVLRAVRSAGHRFASSINFTLQPDTRLLVIRMADDEAGLLLTAYRCFDWILERCLAAVRLGWISIKMSIKMFVFGVKYGSTFAKVVKALPIPVIVILWILGRSSDDPVYDLSVVSLVTVYTVSWVSTVVMTLTVACAILALGPGAALGVLTRNVSVEQSPSGDWNVIRFEPIARPWTLRHSHTYEDPRCLAVLASWISRNTSNQSATSLRPDIPVAESPQSRNRYQ